MAGRPSEYTPEIADAICDRLADGESLRSVCRSEGMPDKTTVFRWMRTNELFRAQYARAKEESADSHADDILEIADDGRNDWMERETKNGGKETVVDHDHISRSRLRIDTRKWIASKLKPKKYGDRFEHVGDPNAPVALLVTGSDVNG